MMNEAQSRWEQFVRQEIYEAVDHQEHFLWSIPSLQVSAIRNVLTGRRRCEFIELHVNRTLKCHKLNEKSCAMTSSDFIEYEQAIMDARRAISPSCKYKYSKSDFKKAIATRFCGLKWVGNHGVFSKEDSDYVLDLTDGLKRLLRYWRPWQISYEGVLGVGNGELDNVFSIDLERLLSVLEESCKRERDFRRTILADVENDWRIRRI